MSRKEKHSIFPDPRSAADDAVAISRSLNCEMLRDAYANGIFPWPFEEESVLWASPRQRGILMLDEFHCPKSFQRELKKLPFIFRIDTAFDAVIRHCAAAERPEGEGTWITRQIIEAYCQLHRMKMAHSFEAFLPDGTLAGGLYGVPVGRIFCGESMFYKVSGASKFAFVKLAEVLKEHGFVMMDTQMVTNLTASFGAREVPCSEYFSLLDRYGAAPESMTF